MNLPSEPTLCVLSSSSGGNCSVLTWVENTYRRSIFIDCGLSPGRTRKLLRLIGLKQLMPDAVILTHLDEDHWHPNWPNFLPKTTAIHIHRNHRARASRAGVLRHRTLLFDDVFEPLAGLSAESLLVPHDDLGSAAFRFTVAGKRLGYATDLGRASNDLVGFMKGVGTLAIESNYCPQMQESAPRPRSLKDRVMNGSGHLSNGECARFCESVGPVDHVVLLHLSRQCNRPELAMEGHRDRAYHLTVAHWREPTGFIPIGPGAISRPWFHENLFVNLSRTHIPESSALSDTPPGSSLSSSR